MDTAARRIWSVKLYCSRAGNHGDLTDAGRVFYRGGQLRAGVVRSHDLDADDAGILCALEILGNEGARDLEPVGNLLLGQVFVIIKMRNLDQRAIKPAFPCVFR